jgi:type IV secretory pathway VirB4 component
MVTSKATQDFVPIKEIRDGIIILKDGSMRAIVMVSSVNFALKSGEEQQAIIMQFQSFLNALDFSIQISIQSKALDIRPYIAMLEGRYRDELGDLMKIQIREYIQFIKNFVSQTSIMTKTFFVVIPFSPTTINAQSNPLDQLINKKKATEGKGTDHFEENRTQLEQRIGSVSQGLTRCGIRSVQLGTEEIVELFYKTFNPGDMEKPMMPTAAQ